MMAKDKKSFCPLSMASSRDDCEYCLKERCEWWYASDGKCSRLVVAEALHEIADHLKQIGMKICQP